MNKIKKIIGAGKTIHGLKDSDGDGVINMLDCKPYDKNKQGFIHDLKERAKWNKSQRKQEKYANQQIKEKSRAAYLREKEKQQIRVAEESARYEANKQIERKKSGGFIGGVGRFVGSVTRKPTVARTPVKRKTQIRYRTVRRKVPVRTVRRKVPVRTVRRKVPVRNKTMRRSAPSTDIYAGVPRFFK